MKPDYIEFQNRREPLAFLITIRTYGTWFHGDERESVDRSKFNSYGSLKISPNRALVKAEELVQKGSSITLDAPMRKIIREAIVRVCEYRGHHLYALNIRTIHVHAVISADKKPESIMHSLKSYSTRALRESGMADRERKIWSRHGNTRYLWTDEHIGNAVEYVVSGQGGHLPEFK